MNTAQAENVNANALFSYEELKEYHGYTKDIKILESKKEALNAKFKERMGRKLIADYKAKFKPYEELILEYIALDTSECCTVEEKERKAKLEKELSAVGFSLDIWDMLVSDNFKGILKFGPIEQDNSDMVAKFGPQDRSTIDKDKAVEFLKRKGLTTCIKTVEVPDEDALDAAIFEGKVSPREFKNACIKENIIVTLTVSQKKAEKE